MVDMASEQLRLCHIIRGTVNHERIERLWYRQVLKVLQKEPAGEGCD
jgi:hypothetical protein